MRTQIRITVSILLAFFRSAAHTRTRKPLGDIAFWLLARPADVAISSQPRYDHFDTAAYQVVRTQIRITVSILLAFFRSAAHTRARKPLGDIAFWLLARSADVAISSADPSTTWVHLQIGHSHRRSVLIQERIGENCWRELRRDK